VPPFLKMSLRHPSLFLFPVALTLDQRASMKRAVSLQFLNPKTVDMTPWTGDQPSQGR
jgi:hypothetical protein